jgi:hypothetical protein
VSNTWMKRITRTTVSWRAAWRKYQIAIIVCAGLGATLAIGGVWQIGRGPTLEIKPTTKLLLIVDALALSGRSPTVDEVELLSRQSDEAVPLLVNCMIANSAGTDRYEYWSWSMEALAKIGGPAVPKLVNTMESARELASSHDWKASDFALNLETCSIRIRAAMVLGRIADDRALPALLKVRSQSDHCRRYEVDSAIENIRKRQPEKGN